MVNRFSYLAFSFLVGFHLPTPMSLAEAPRQNRPPTAQGSTCLSVIDFLPTGYATDGSALYKNEIQKALDTAAEQGKILIFPRMVIRVDESGWELRSNLTLYLDNAIFKLDENCKKDGQVFRGRDIANVTIQGGKIVGRNDAWPAGVNIRGIYITGQSNNIRIRDIRMKDLSSNGIGIFGIDDQSIRDVWIDNVVIEHSGNSYNDYLTEKPGPEAGSSRDDQGLITLYYVEDFVVQGCRLERSRSDGTHFYRCRGGQFTNNKVYAAKMGGYFVETCNDIVATSNILRDNGSRGATIERGSRNCVFKSNIVSSSGREGLWAPQCVGLIITSNIFDRNGRKSNGPRQQQIWNANITINEDPADPTRSTSSNYVITNNILYTSASQIAAIRLAADKTKGLIIRNNILRDENRRILIEGVNKANVILDND